MMDREITDEIKERFSAFI